MPTKGNKALSGYRRRLNRNEVVRVEIHVRNDDARLRDCFGVGKAKGLKKLLAAAPLEGINLERDRDYGRDIEL